MKNGNGFGIRVMEPWFRSSGLRYPRDQGEPRSSFLIMQNGAGTYLLDSCSGVESIQYTRGTFKKGGGTVTCLPAAPESGTLDQWRSV